MESVKELLSAKRQNNAPYVYIIGIGLVIPPMITSTDSEVKNLNSLHLNGYTLG